MEMDQTIWLNGSQMLSKWQKQLSQPFNHRVLVDRAIPLEWETPFPAPDPAVYAGMDGLQIF